jgi:hypothetical protein
MMQIIRERRAAHAKCKAEREQQKRRYDTEGAVRRRHNLNDSHHFTDDFWDVPIPAITARKSYLSIKARQRMAERKARGNKLRPLPPRSSLSHSELAAEVTLDDDEAAKLRAAKAERERASWERQVRQVSGEVGYLYFVGTVKDWRQDFVQSKDSLIWRAERGEDAWDTDSEETTDSEDEIDTEEE